MTLSHIPPRPSSHPKLVSASPSASAPASVRISHVQLRDLIVCPAERGVLWYVSENSIIEQDILSSTPERQRTLAVLKFTPVTLSTLRLASSHPNGKDVILLAAGGQDAELFLALFVYTPRHTRKGKEREGSADSLRADNLSTTPEFLIDLDSDTETDVKAEGEGETPGYSTSSWQHTSSLVGSINNNVLLYMPPPPVDLDLDEDTAQARTVSPRLVVSNNDCTVKFFDVCMARKGLRRSNLQRPQDRIIDTRYWRQDPGFRGSCEGEGWGEKGMERIVRYERVGCLRLPVPVNHTSISPDGSTVLSCGDTSTIYLHRILPVRDGSSLLFEPLATYNIPPPTPLPPLPPPPPSSPHPQRRSYGPRYSGQRDPGGAYLPFAFVNGSWVLAGPHPYLNDVSGMEIPPACFATAWSADGMRFAVASQEGMVRVWDVRSKEPLGCAGWETGPGGAAADAEAAAREGRTRSSSALLSAEMQRALLEFTGGAPPWGVRTLKFVRNASGRELLVFTEHVSHVHVIDADTFSRHDVLRIPHVQSSASGPQIRDDTRLPPFRPIPGTAQLYAISPSDLPRLLDGIGSDSTPNYLPRFIVDTSAVWRGSGDDAAGSNDNSSGSAPGPRLTSRLEGRARARRLGLVPPRSALPESRDGTGRVLSPNVPLSRSPEPGATTFRSPSDVILDEQAFDNYAAYQRGMGLTSGPGRLTLAQRITDRLRARERERRELDQEQNELRRRSPISRLRDDAQMEEDIAYHAALERVRSGRERERDLMELARARSLARLEARRARAQQLRERDERSQAGTEVAQEETERNAEQGPIVIPPLSSARSEEDVRSVLAVHGIPSVRSTAATETEGDDSRTEQLLSSSNLLDANDGRPNSSSASTVSSTSPSEATGFSTRAQAGSLLGEQQNASTTTSGGSSNPLMNPVMREAAQDALEYWMDVDAEDENRNDEDDSDSTELDCAEPGLGVSAPNVQTDTPRSVASAVSAPSEAEDAVTVSSSTAPSSALVALAASTSTITIPDSSSSTSSSSSPTTTTSVSEQPTSSSPPPEREQARVQSQSHSLPPCRDLIESTDRLDIAGITFDPTGAYMYVATVDGITEWAVQGVEQRWWHSGGCI